MMQETSGPTIHDVVAGRDGTMNVGTTAGSAGYWTAWTANNGSAFGMGGSGALSAPGDKAIYFTNATGTFILVPYSAAFNTPQFTVEAWMRFPSWPLSPAAATVDLMPLSFDFNGGSQAGWSFYLSDGQSGTQPGDLQSWCGKGAGWTQLNPAVNYANQWIHAVMSYDGTTLRQYVNGTLRGSAAGAYSLPATYGGPPLMIGASVFSGTSQVGRVFQGGISHVAVYSNVLSATQVLNHFNASTNVLTSPFVVITAPTNGASYTATASVTVSATTNGASGLLRSISFYSNGALLGTVSNAPYTLTATGPAAGGYALTAVATNTSGSSSTSAPVNITVTSDTGQPYGLTSRAAAPAFFNMPTIVAGGVPPLLSQTGVFSNTPSMTPTNGLIPYTPNTPLWSDGAAKTRYVSVPNNGGAITPNQQITFGPTGYWTFPAGTVFVKTFELNTDTTQPNVRHRL